MQQDSGVQHFYQTDALGSVRGFTNNGQSPLGEVYYDAFGLPALRQGSMPWPLGFAGSAGYQTDADTGLMLLGNRYYDPSIGRFLSPDPSGSGDNWYAYCDNNPTGELDPTGLDRYPVNPDGTLGPGIPYAHDDNGNAIDENGDPLNGTYYNGDSGQTTNFDNGAFTGSTTVAINSGPPGYGDAFTSGLSVGISAVASAATFHLYDGGAAKHDPTFATARGFGDVGVAAGTAAIPVGSLAAGAKTVFYSGQGALDAARAGKGAGLLLEDTVGGKVLNALDQRLANGLPTGVWKAASAIFAANAKGTVTAFLRNPTAGSVWNTVEKPILTLLQRAVTYR